MKTSFTPAQLADPSTATSQRAIRTCVHCGLCTATCPTYVLLGDERDSPRGRIWLIKEMLERNATPTREIVTHIDRCLSCLACVTTCPSGVDYTHLIDHARRHVEETYQRPRGERLLRSVLARVLSHPRRFAAGLALGRMVAHLAPSLQRLGAKRIAALLRLAQANRPIKEKLNSSPATGTRKGRVILLSGCAEPVLRPQYQAAATRLLNRLGYDVERPDEICCGSLAHHMGRQSDALASAKHAIDAWSAVIDAGQLDAGQLDAGPLDAGSVNSGRVTSGRVTSGRVNSGRVNSGKIDAIITTISGCGATIKDYGFMLSEDPVYGQRAARISALAKDITEFVSASALQRVALPKLRVAYHAACSLQHGQKVITEPTDLLKRAGFEVVTPANAHLCCGSAGTYNILQPEIADELGDRKRASLEALSPDLIATGNIGCAVQIGMRTVTPVLHVAELLDWATGGPRPASLSAKMELRP